MVKTFLYRGVKVRLSVNAENEMWIEDETKQFLEEPKQIGKVYKQSENNGISKWVAHDETREVLTFASTKRQAIWQLVEKINSNYVKTDSAYFHQKGLRDLRETIRLEQALYMLQSKEVMGVGFIEATFDSEPKRTPMEYGWFDLRDDDINLVIKENHLSLELWFNGLYGIDEPHLGVRTISVQDGEIIRTVDQVKLKLNISHEQLDYVIKDGTRYHIEKK